MDSKKEVQHTRYDSLSICRQYAEKDKRVRIINKPNGGSTSSRKAGAKIAKGEYVICVDSDDYVEQGYFSCVARSLDEFNPDIVVLSHYSLEGNKKILNKDFVVQDLLQDKEYEEVRDKFIYDPTDKNISNPGIISYSLWCKVVRREIYVKAQELFEFITFISVYFCFTLSGLLITPFVQLYTNGITDVDYIQPIFGVLIVMAEGLYLIKEPHLDLSYSANKFKELSVPAFVEAGINILVSIILVHKLGLIGVAIGTIAGMTYRMALQAILCILS